MKPRPNNLPEPNTRQEIVYLADGMIRRRGFNAFSYGDLSAIMDVRPPAIHYHFRSKADLGKEVVRQELFRVRAFRRENAQLRGDEQLKHLFTVFYRNSQGQNSCLMGSLLPEYATLDHPMQREVEELSKEISDWVTGCLEDARERGRLQFAGTAADRALLVLSALLASLLLGRVQGMGVFERMADQLLEDLGVAWRIADLGVPKDRDILQEDPHSFT